MGKAGFEKSHHGLTTGMTVASPQKHGLEGKAFWLHDESSSENEMALGYPETRSVRL